jgi:hypothetical protein
VGRVSVPLWLAVLSDQLPVRALVGHYPTNKLIGRRGLPKRFASLLRARNEDQKAKRRTPCLLVKGVETKVIETPLESVSLNGRDLHGGEEELSKRRYRGYPSPLPTLLRVGEEEPVNNGFFPMPTAE